MGGIMVRLFEIIFTTFWELVNIKIPIDGGLYVTPWSLFLFAVILAMLIKFAKKKGESKE